jgi:Hpt domain
LARLTEAQRAELDALRRTYEAELPEKLGLIEEAAEALRRGGWQKVDLQALYLPIHKLAGSAAIYGVDGVSRVAGELETWALAGLEGGLPESRRGELGPLVSALREEVAAVGKGRVRARARETR